MSHVHVCEGVPNRGCHTEFHACYGYICVFPRLCEKPLEKLTRDEFRSVNRMRKQCDLKPLKLKRKSK